MVNGLERAEKTSVRRPDGKGDEYLKRSKKVAVKLC